MASMLAKFVSKKILGETLQNNFGKEDPYYERQEGKKVRKALPTGLSRHDTDILKKVKRRAYRLDMSLFNCCGIRFGWSSVIGIIPGIGDIIDAFMAMMVLRTCQQIEGGLPANVKAKMMTNIVLDFLVGLTPVIGDLFDAVFRANTRNAIVLEKYLRDKGARSPAAPAVDSADPDPLQRKNLGPPPQYTTGQPSQLATQSDNGRSKNKQQQNSSEQSGGKSWLSSIRSGKREQDVERGEAQRREDEPLPRLPNDVYVRSDEPRRNTSAVQKNRN